ncbi:MAG: ABC transporter permease [Bacteroidaceae bacterium]|nr:ABC transporter permease [Bacteroidaceae bacterium]
MRDLIQEILVSLSRNKLRTALTGFAVAWGIFMLLVLLGAGNGIIHTFQANMNTNALNTVTVYGGMTTNAYKGYKEGRYIELDNRDLKATEEDFPENITSTGGLVRQNNVTVSYGSEYVSIRLNGVHPNYDHINALKIIEGRFINPLDIRERRKIIVLHKNTAELLFKHTKPMGKYVKAGNTNYQVAGIYNDQGNDQNAPAYIPFTTLQQIFNKGNHVNLIVATTEGLDTQEKSDVFETEYRKKLAGIHDFDPNDKSALYISNRLTQYQQTMTAMGLLQLSLWIIGIFTLMSGIVGVSNIMFITVKERTHEFGIRKALGAKPRAIYKLIVVESIAITTLFGYIGMVCGVAATEWMNKAYGSTTVDLGENNSATMFIDPTVDISIAIGATLLLIFAGILAGLFPARKAANVRPIESLNAR